MAGSIDALWVENQINSNINRVLNPSVCHSALAKLQRPDSNFCDIADILAGDPFISAKVVAVANLARGREEETDGTEVCSIERAVGLLGVKQVESLVLSVMLIGPLASRPYLEHRDDIWRFIFGCAAAGNWLIPRLGPKRDEEYQDHRSDTEALATGLVLGLGVQLLYAGLGTAYSRVLGRRIRPTTLAEREREHLGVDHHYVTCWALESLHCPAYLNRYPWALATTEQSAAGDEARAIEMLACRAAGFETNRCTALLRELLDRLKLDHLDRQIAHDLPAIRRRVSALARAFKLDLAVSEEDRSQRNRQATQHAGRHLGDLVERDARKLGDNAA